MTSASTLVEPQLPDARGPLSLAVLSQLTEHVPHHHLARIEASLGDSDPYGIDLQLTLYVCYELHYRGFAGVDPRWEWNAGLLHLRGQLENAFLAAVRQQVGEIGPDERSADEMDRLSVEPIEGTGPSNFLRDQGDWEQMREYFAHRSLYHLKEGDPHAWAIPRLTGQAKASFVAVEFNEYGGGRGARVHQQLFADLLDAAGLDSSYLGYLERRPGRRLGRGELDVTVRVAPRVPRRGDRAFRVDRDHLVARFAPVGGGAGAKGAPEPCIGFYREHVEADAVHEQVVGSEPLVRERRRPRHVRGRSRCTVPGAPIRSSASTNRREPGDEVISVDAKCPMAAPRRLAVQPEQ